MLTLINYVEINQIHYKPAFADWLSDDHSI